MKYCVLNLFLLLQFAICAYSISESDCGIYTVDIKTNIHDGKRLINHNVPNQSVSHPLQCFFECSDNCLCESFNVCDNVCELSSSTREKSPSDYLDREGCSYYDMGRVKPSKPPQLTSSCGGSEEMFCCRKHNPCLNGGVCVGFCPDTGKRFECRCKSGCYGNRCQYVRPTTCQDYMTTPKPANGIYTVVDESGNEYRVYCDFNSEEGMAWTLMLSFARSVGYTVHLSDYSPKNVDSAGSNWNDYRLPKDLSILMTQTSTHWRMTCSYDNHGIDYRDYLRSKLSETNFMTYDQRPLTAAQKCRKVEYVNIRGSQCADCTISLWQGVYGIHSNSNLNPGDGNCDLVTTHLDDGCPTGHYEYYWNLYMGSTRCITGQFRCSATDQSTTQLWIGG